MQFALDPYESKTANRITFRRQDFVRTAAAEVISSIKNIQQADWDACFPGELEGYSYLLAIEEAEIDGVDFRYIVVSEGERILACMPAFQMMYNLTTTLDPCTLKRRIEWVQQRIPKFMRIKMGCLGSPETECGYVGFHPSVGDQSKRNILERLVTAFETDAKAAGCYLLAVKDAPVAEPLWDEVAKSRQYSLTPGMATAHLDIDFKTIDEYLQRFSSSGRKDMRRKLKSLSDVRIEHKHDIGDILDDVYSLYLQTMRRAELHLNTLPKAYFAGVLAHMKERSLVTLYYLGEKLVAANLHLVDRSRLLDKFFVMDGEEGRKHNLYFVSWFVNLQYCLDNGIPHYHSGQACYDVKVRLKSYLRNNRLLFKHVKPGVNRIFRAAAPLFALDETKTA